MQQRIRKATPYRGSRMKKGHRQTKLLTLIRILFILFTITFCVLSYMVGSQLISSYKEKKLYDKLSSITEEANKSPGESSDSSGDSLSDGSQDGTTILKQYKELYEMNPDLFGWVSIPNTKLDYPVMYKPDEKDYYLRRAFDGSNSMSGVPYIDEDCFPGCGNLLIYGHYMKNGTIFTTLLSYAEQEFWKANPVITFNTMYEEEEYQIMAAFYSRVYAVDETGVFRFYKYTDLTDRDVFEEYVLQLKESALYDTGITAEYGDELITLTTCSYHVKNGRFVVVACKKS